MRAAPSRSGVHFLEALGLGVLGPVAAVACSSSSAPVTRSTTDAATSDAATANDAGVVIEGSVPDGSAPDASAADGVATDGAAGAFAGTISYAAFGSDGYTHIFTATGGGVTAQLTSTAADDETAEWSPDGSRIAFQRSDSTGLAVYVMNADGTGSTRLSPDPGKDLLPGFSADGTQIVFTHVIDPMGCNGGSLATASVMIMSATDGSGRTTLVDGTKASTCFNVEPRFAPDGSKVVFMCGPSNGSIQACTVNPDGSGYALLTNTSGTVTGDPHWSWDSKKLGISRKDASGNVNVWTMNADGSNLLQLTHFVEPVEGGDVGWSLDDSQLAFEQDVGGSGQSVPDAGAHVSIVHADGTGLVSLPLPCSDIGCGPRFRP